MLQIKDISKKYITGNLEQMALDGVSLNLRDNEFVAILGPSGSGKTTLLNIIGGLDRYDTGDLIINGVTTKRYKDRDWDSYRNHTIGFVFQSYNLIPHQTVLANVELALTIGGISKSERRRRAEEALEKVGLKEHIFKKPNQMSGGQMQRVAIARALVNDPNILLADEPTGALDSETSVQVMDLLKEVAEDRLVVMVTHNPELAEQYATRIVTLKDGKITSDSDPFTPEPSAEGEPVHRNLGKASMSFLTALTLSFNNLWTKKARTILVAFAGSIGIIGIALILSLSNGVNKYIEETEEETLSAYPLEIQKTSFDLNSFASFSNSESSEEEPEDGAELKEVPVVSSMFSTMDSNDLGTLKKYLDGADSHVLDYAKAVEYHYNITPWIFRQEVDEGEEKIRQVCPSTLTTMYSGEVQAYSMMGLSMEVFYQLPEDEDLYLNEYDVMAGRWPENSGEAVFVLRSRDYINDYMLYTLGFKDSDELDEMIKKFSEGEVVDVVTENPLSLKYQDFVGINFKVVPAYAKFSYDERYKVWTDKSDDKNFMKNLVENGKDLTIVGVVAPKENARVSMLYLGINYTPDLTDELMEGSQKSAIVKDQLSKRNIDVFTGKEFGDTSGETGFDMASMFEVDEEAFANAFNFNADGMNLDSMDLSNIDMSNMDFSNLDFSSIDLSSVDFSNIDTSSIDMSNLDLSGLDLESLIDTEAIVNSIPEFDANDISKLFEGVEVNVTREQLADIFNKVVSGYQEAAGNEIQDMAGKITSSVGEFFTSEDFRNLVDSEVQGFVNGFKFPEFNQKDLADMVDRVMAGFSDFASGYDPNGEKTLQEYLQEYLATGEIQAILSQEVETIGGLVDQIELPEIDINAFSTKISDAYMEYATKNSVPGISDIMNSFTNYMNSEDARNLVRNSIQEIIDTDAVGKKLRENAAPLIAKYLEPAANQVTTSLSAAIGPVVQQSISSMMSGYSSAIEQAMTQAMTQFGSQFAEAIMSNIGASMSSAFGSMFENMEDAFSIDEEALSNAFKFNMTEKELEELMTSLMSSGYSTYDTNLIRMGYAEEEEPYSISIYPVNFESKDGIINILDAYNKNMEESDQEEKVVRYTDLVGTLMSSVTDIINSISYVLIAFVAISLVVSSIMIGVITYISVLERRKEIGILRAIGASKGNISGVFNAETFIIGLLAGLFGVGLSRLLLIPGNYLIRMLSDADVTAVLPLNAAVILVILSVILTLIGGIIPSRKAAKSDPVIALRTE